MANVVVNITSTQDVGDLSFAGWGKGRVSREVAKLIEGLGTGSFSGSMDVQNNAGYAAAVLIVSAGSGADGATIGGRLVTSTWATSDILTAEAIAAAINADATANKFVQASSRTASGTLTIASGSGVITAIIGGVSVSVTWATSDTATATALAAAVNAAANSPVVATSAAGVVTFYAVSPLYVPGTTGVSALGNSVGNTCSLQGTGTGVTVSAAQLANGGGNGNNYIIIRALVPGTVGAGITSVASGTGVTVPTGANLVGGVGQNGSNTFSC